MYLLDTNVISEMRKIQTGRADLRLSGWVERVSSEDLYLSAVTIFEMEVGVRLMMRKDPARGGAGTGYTLTFCLPSQHASSS